MLSLRDHIPPAASSSPLHPLSVSLSITPSSSTHHSLSPRWPWGRPVWNVIGIIPFSLIASAGERSYVSPRMPTEPLRTHYTHISHRNFLKAESHTGMHALAGLLQGSCTSHAQQCKVPVQSFVYLFSVITILFLPQTHAGGGLHPVCISTDETESQTVMLRGACHSKWPRGKEGLIWAWVCGCACTCSHACAHLPWGAVVQWVKGDDSAKGRIWGVVHCNGGHNETLLSPRQPLTYYSH